MEEEVQVWGETLVRIVSAGPGNVVLEALRAVSSLGAVV